MEIPSKFDAKGIESKWYAFWQENNFFKSVPDEREPYTIVIPPPNVTGILHMGHMLNNSLQDIIIRRARMRGYNACWVPGTDHASIATEAKVVAKLKAFFTKHISALAAKVALFVGLSFYLLTTFVFDTGIHFVHIWGIEFLLNLALMFWISYYYPNKNQFQIKDLKLVKMEQWKYTKPFSIFLFVVTLIIYITMGSFDH